jgi:hypothetical protein
LFGVRPLRFALIDSVLVPLPSDSTLVVVP